MSSIGWSGDAFGARSDFTISLSDEERRAFLEVLEAPFDGPPPWGPQGEVSQGAGDAGSAAGLSPRLLGRIDRAVGEVRDGRGFVVLSGLPLDGLSLDEVKRLFWAFGLAVGRPQSQSNLGDRIGEVRDVTDVDPHARGYRSRRALALHTDICDMIALLAVRPARSGGLTELASAQTVHDLFAAERPDLLPALYRGFNYHRRGEEAPGEAPVTPHKVPVFSRHEGQLSLRYVRPYIENGLSALGADDPELIEALDQLDRFAARVKLTFSLELGEILLINNLTVLHARTAFEDLPDPAQRRLLLRMWLNADGFRPQLDALAVYGDGDGIPYVAGRTSSFAGFS